MPLISVIMPAYNAVNTLADAIDSVIGQTFTDWELIVIDDASTDDTLSMIKAYQLSDKRIKLLALPENGWMANARNQGIAIATGEYLAFLDSDDIWLKNKLATQVDFHSQHSQISISHTDFDMFNREAIKKRPFKNIIGHKYKKEGNIIPSIYCKNTVAVLTVLVKRADVLAVNAFDITIRGTEDQDLWIRLAENGAQFGYINQKLALYRLNESGITHSIGKYKRAYKNILIKHKTNALLYNVHGLALANYYRYFGLFYFSKKQFRLAALHMYASIKNDSYIPDKFITAIFYLLCVLRNGVNNLKR